MKYEQIRTKSLAEVTRLGYTINPTLPLLDSSGTTRSKNEALSRLLSLYAIVAASYGMPRDKALSWLEQESLAQSLTEPESEFLAAKPNPKKDNEVQWSVEALWVLAWGCGYHDALNFGDSCADDFIKLLPDLNTLQPTREFMRRAKMRELQELEAMLDLAYCIHWSVRDAQLNNRKPPGKLPSAVVEQRRKALEWLTSDTPWEEVTLDT